MLEIARRTCGARRGVIVIAIAIAGGAAVIGCGGGGGFDSGVDDDKPFNTLTAEEARTACEAFSDYLSRQIPLSRQYEVSCTVDALGRTTTPADCRAAVDACLAGTPRAIFMDLDCSMPMTSTTCSAPVGEVEECIVADVGVFVRQIDMVRCDIAGNSEALMRLSMAPPAPSECTSLGSTCPELADGLIGR